MSDINVPFLDLAQVYRAHKAVLDRAWQRVMERGWFVLGPEVEGFERQFASAVQAPWCVGVANGTDAIELGLRALGVGPGTEVVTTPLTAMPTLLGIAATGATIRLADVSRRSGLVDPAAMAAAVGPNTVALVPVHLYGQTCDMDAILEIAATHGLRVLEDCAQAHLATFAGRPAGSFGDLAAWSFYPTKNLGACGDAGAVTGSGEALRHAIRTLRNYGQRETYNHVLVGRNSRLDELQAAILTALLPTLAQSTERRRCIAHYYRDELRGSVEVVSGADDDGQRASCYHLFTVVSPDADRERFRARLQARGVGTLVHYPTPAHKQKAFAHLGYAPDSFPHSSFLADRVVSLPLHAHLSDREAEHVVHAVRGLT